MAVTERLSTGGVLTWNSSTVLKVRDVEFGGTASPEDVTGQEDGSNRDYVAGLIEFDFFRCTIIYDKRDTVHDALDDDFAANTTRTFTWTGPDGIVYSFTGAIEEFNENAPLGSVVTAELVIMITDRDTVSVAGV